MLTPQQILWDILQFGDIITMVLMQIVLLDFITLCDISIVMLDVELLTPSILTM